MAGANYFIIYTDSAGTNVTLSPRLSSGNVMPSYNSAVQVTLLAGSGISDGVMTANIKCSSCASWSGGSMDLTASSTAWIWAYKGGSSLSTDSKGASIVKHDDYGDVTFDSSAQGGSDANPFLNSNGTSTTNSACSSVSSSSGSAATTYSSSISFTRTTNGPFGQQTASAKMRRSSKVTAEILVKRAVSGSNCEAGSNASTSFVGGGNNLIAIHGIMAAVVFCLVFPIGGIMIRLLSFPGLLWVHGGLQLVAYAIFIAAIALGVKLAKQPVRFKSFPTK
jgi:Cytochrome domain of cellobiose dehydrogenase